MHHRPGHTNFAEHVDFLENTGRKVEVIVRFERNVLREVAVLKKFLEIDRNAFAFARQETLLEVYNVDRVLAIENSRLQAVRARDGFDYACRMVEREGSGVDYFAEDEIFFAVVSDRRDDGAGCAVEFP